MADAVADLVAGPRRRMTVLGTHAAAVIARVDPGPSATGARVRVISILAAEASGVPNGIRSTLHSAERPFAHIAPGSAGAIGGGFIEIPRLVLRAARTVRTTVPRVAPSAGTIRAIADAAHAAPRGVADGPVAAFRDALAGAEPARLRTAVHGLVGLGSGSTPGGDDVLAGALAGLLAAGRRTLARQVAASALPGIEGRTPALSAELLHLAADGHLCAEAAAVLRAVARPAGPARERALHGALAGLLRIGHTSGADLATGIAIGLGTALTSTAASFTTPPQEHAADREERIEIHE